MLFVASAQTNYELDKNHAGLGLSTTHFGISHVEGSLKSKSADFSDAVIEMTAMISSINTDSDVWDKDLKTDKWFDAAKYPTLTFKSSSFKKVSGNNYKLQGSITIHCVTKPIIFYIVFNGKAMNTLSKKNDWLYR